jgi:hypothetical protein
MKALLAIAILCATAAACGDGSGGTGDAAPGAICGGRGNAACPAGQYCDFANNRCGANDAPGRCVARPTSCPQLFVPELTCGCDQVVYSSACEANLSGTDLNEGGTCPVGSGEFGCGYRHCRRSSEFCRRDGSDVAGVPDDFTCRGLPSGCTSCSCLAGEPCGSSCTGSGATGMTLTCPGG